MDGPFTNTPLCLCKFACVCVHVCVLCCLPSVIEQIRFSKRHQIMTMAGRWLWDKGWRVFTHTFTCLFIYMCVTVFMSHGWNINLFLSFNMWYPWACFLFFWLFYRKCLSTPSLSRPQTWRATWTLACPTRPQLWSPLQTSMTTPQNWQSGRWVHNLPVDNFLFCVRNY